MPTRVFRLHWFYALLAPALILLGIYFCVDAIGYLRAYPDEVANWTQRGVSNPANHYFASDKAHAYMNIVIGICFLPAGILTAVAYATRSITLDMDGVIVRGIGGGIKFQARYVELRHLLKCYGTRNSSYYNLASTVDEVAFTGPFGKFRELAEELKRRAPQIRIDLS